MNELAKILEAEIRPLVSSGGKYDCCGCSTYEQILDHAIRIVNEHLPEMLDDAEIFGRYGGDTR